MKIESVFFGIMVGDLFGDEGEDTINVDASIRQYAGAVETALRAEYGADIEVNWESENATGVVPAGLRTRINGEDDHDEIEYVDILIGNVWQRFDWVVYLGDTAE